MVAFQTHLLYFVLSSSLVGGWGWSLSRGGCRYLHNVIFLLRDCIPAGVSSGSLDRFFIPFSVYQALDKRH